MPKKHGSPAQPLTKSDLVSALGALEKRVDSKIETLAQAVQVGFEETNGRIDLLQQDVTELKQDVTELKKDVTELKGDVRRIDTRLYRQQEMIDWGKQTIGNHGRRMKVLEARARARS